LRRFAQAALMHLIEEQRHGERRRNSDDDHHHQELDQGKAGSRCSAGPGVDGTFYGHENADPTAICVPERSPDKSLILQQLLVV
jgi:hypothetical protein